MDRPAPDEARVAAVHATGAFDEPTRARLDRVARMAARATTAPAALTSLLSADEHVVIAAGGPDSDGFPVGNRMPAEDTFCAHVVASGRPVAVDDAGASDRFAPISEITGVSAYLGVPLRSSDDQVLGALCAIDTTPRAWTDDDLAALEDLAVIVQEDLHLRAALRDNKRLLQALYDESRTDDLTQLPNRREWRERLDRELARARRLEEPLCVAVLDLDHFKQVNDRQGHAAGDAILRTVGERWRAEVRAPDTIARLGGDEFGLVLLGSDHQAGDRVVSRVVEAARDTVAVSYGLAEWDGTETASELVARADHALLAAKRQRPAGGRAAPRPVG